MNNSELLTSLAAQLEIEQSNFPEEKLHALIRERIGELIANDLNRLILILYRLDVSEKKLNESLERNKEGDAATIITDLVIERQLQKLNSRKQEYPFKKDDNIPEDEKW